MYGRTNLLDAFLAGANEHAPVRLRVTPSWRRIDLLLPPFGENSVNVHSFPENGCERYQE